MRTTSSVRTDLELFEVKRGLQFPAKLLREMLPDAETVLFFGKVYELDYVQLSSLMQHCIKTDLVDALLGGSHSTDLQGYIVDELNVPGVNTEDVQFSSTAHAPAGEILPEVWKSLEVTVAKAIKDVAAKLGDTVGRMPGKQGQMMFKSLMQMNRQRPTIGDFRATIGHGRLRDNLIVLDVSGSMSESTVRRIIDDVVAMAYMANAHLAIVSNDSFHWEPGNYDAAAVLRKAQFGGTHYETLADLMQRDWGVVVTIADYDSSRSAAEHLARTCRGHIEELVDISLVNRSTFLAECLGQFADKVTPVLVGNSYEIIAG